MNKNSKIYVAGHTGLVGNAILRLLTQKGYTNIVSKTHSDLNLEDESQTKAFFEKEKPEYVFLCAAKAGGIKENNEKPVEFILRNIKIQTNVIDASYHNEVRKLLFMGSSCIYPRITEQPIKEEYYMTGKLEPTNEAYAVAKIAGISMCQAYKKQYGCDFISVMPNNIYGPGDHFELERSHVIPALMRRFYNAQKENVKDITLWGTGVAIREFLHCDDLAEASLFLMEKYNDPEIINVGTGGGITIKDLSTKIRSISGFKGEIVWDSTKPDGMPIRLLDTSKINSLGWNAKIDFDKGLKETYKWFTQYAA